MKIEHLTFSYGKDDIFVDTSFIAKKGDITVIKGESGCGESTLLDILSLRYDRIGQYLYNNCLIDSSFINNISYIQQNSILPLDLKIIDQWKLLMDLYNKNFQLEKYIERLQMKNICNLYSQQISGGEKQRVLLINALIMDKPILLLDEPTASLNEEMKKEFVKILEENKENHIIIVSTHDDCFDNEDQIYYIKDKKLISYMKNNDNNELIKDKKINQNKINWLYYFF